MTGRKAKRVIALKNYGIIMAAAIYLGKDTGVPGNGVPNGYHVGGTTISEIYLGDKRII